ncbi:hypothetical protein CMO92_02165 [Candidatus Woesearchaeota archaeon]|nr:hypothetical protein [Candidatus Woesearchaeota archaeon]|tara:strand:+ start:2833 stop:3087 length:255 start_codon:yes stop_codon:yes gene_type:complete
MYLSFPSLPGLDINVDEIVLVEQERSKVLIRFSNGELELPLDGVVEAHVNKVRGLTRGDHIFYVKIDNDVRVVYKDKERIYKRG